MFSAQVHENHFYLAVPLLAIGAGFVPSWRPLFWAISAMTAFNMYIFYGFGVSWSPEIDRRWTIVDMTVIASFINVGLFVWLTRRTWRDVVTTRQA
jgi:peptidoglycan/LPS O-acetylase OafA/YrhL